jgi:hypothetical protein
MGQFTIGLEVKKERPENVVFVGLTVVKRGVLGPT